MGSTRPGRMSRSPPDSGWSGSGAGAGSDPGSGAGSVAGSGAGSGADSGAGSAVGSGDCSPEDSGGGEGVGDGDGGASWALIKPAAKQTESQRFTDRGRLGAGVRAGRGEARACGDVGGEGAGNRWSLRGGSDRGPRRPWRGVWRVGRGRR
jgi:hypothetical protein